MKILIESLKRLYKENKITSEKLLNMVNTGKITMEEYEYIIN